MRIPPTYVFTGLRSYITEIPFNTRKNVQKRKRKISTSDGSTYEGFSIILNKLIASGLKKIIGAAPQTETEYT
jgi:hypothetical protein